MDSEFSSQVIKGRSFQGQTLSGLNFSHADVRGIDFSGADLHDTNLSDIKAGLTFLHETYLKIGLVVLVALLIFISGYSGTFLGEWLPDIESLIGQIFFIFLGVCLPACLVFIILRKGIDRALTSFVAAGAVLLTLLIAVAGVHDAVTGILLIAIWFAIGIAIVVTGAIVAAVVKILPGKRIWLVLAAVTPIATASGIYVSVIQGDSFSQAWMVWLGIGSAVTSTIIWVCLSIYVGSQAMLENSKYVLVYQFAIAISNYGSTSFRNANLTDADFSNANLRQADFRNANLTRTRWHHAKFLAQARTDEEYLEDPTIRQLVVTLSGQGQNFDHFDLCGLNLEGSDLADASFIGAKLSGTTLKGANLSGAKLVQTQLYGANLNEASLTGTYIQDWSISTDTNFDGVKCDYVYMQLPTKADPDPCRKPDNRNENFEPGDFADFIAPIIKTLNLYQTQNVDLRVVAQQFKTLDLFHHEGIDPAAAAVALKQLAEHYPEADLEVVALEGRGDDKVRLQAKVKGAADRSQLSAEYFAAYREMSSMPYADLQSLLAGMAEKDERIRSLENMVTTAIQSDKFYVETVYSLGDTVTEKSSININAGGDIGSLSGIVGGDVSGVMNLGTISGNVTNSIGQLPDDSVEKAELKALLQQLQAAIEAEPTLEPEDKAEALAQVQVLAEASQNPEDSTMQKAAKTAIKILKGTTAGLSETTKFVAECAKLLPAISGLLILL